MTRRSEVDQLRAEAKARFGAFLVSRSLQPSDRGLPRLARRMIAARLGPLEHDPELDHDDP